MPDSGKVKPRYLETRQVTTNKVSGEYLISRKETYLSELVIIGTTANL